MNVSVSAYHTEIGVLVNNKRLKHKVATLGRIV